MTESLEFDENVLDHLAMLRDTWSDEIPSKVIHSDSRINSKARRNWFAGVVADTEVALNEGKINRPEAIDAAKRLMKRFTSRKFTNSPLTRKEHIEEANALIDIILGKRSR